MGQSIPSSKAPPRSRARSDALIIAVLCVVVLVVAHWLDVFEHVSAWGLAYRETGIDEAITVLVFLAFALVVYAFRRRRELKAEVTERTRAEESLRGLHGELETRVQQRTGELSTVNAALLAGIAERQQADALLREREHQLRLFIEHSPAAIAMFDLDMRYLVASHRWLTDYRLGEQDIIGRSHYEVFPEIPERWKAIHRRCLAGAVEKCEADEFPRADGSTDWVRWEIQPWHTGQGDIGGLIVFSEVITERKRLEEALTQRSRLAALGAEVGVALIQPGSLREILRHCAEALVTHLDAAFARVWTLNEVDNVLELQASAGMYTHLDGAHGCVPVGQLKIGLIASERKPHLTNSVVGDLRVNHQEWAKREGMVAFAGYPLVVEDRLVGVIAMFARHPLAEATLAALGSVADGIALGIERKRAEARLLLQGAALAAAANEVVITDRAGLIQWVNPAFTKSTGYTLAEAVGHNSGELIKSGQHDPAFYQNLWATILRGETWHGELVNRRKDQSLFTEESTITPVKNEHGEITHFIAIKQDITERKLLEAKFLRSQRMESLGSLAGGIAHDLNNALAPILMSTELLKLVGKDPNPEVGRILDAIYHSAERGAGMVKQILTFARGSEGARGVVQPKHLVQEMIDLTRHSFPRTIQIRADVAPDLWTLQGNPTQLHQILLNLCVNARDAMPTGGTLTLAASNVRLTAASAELPPDAQPGPYVLLTVTDTGTGMTPEVLARVFEAFFTTKEPGKGTGLGLATVRNLAKDHGGFLTVDSELGKGTTFKVYLPASETTAAPVVAIERPALPMGHGELILVVDDEAAIRGIATQTLVAFGYRVLTADDGVQAVAVCAQNRASLQLLITDMAMPFMDGRATIRAIHNLLPRLPVIAASGSDALVESARQQGLDVQAFLRKPFSTDDLIRAVHTALHDTPAASGSESPR